MNSDIATIIIIIITFVSQIGIELWPRQILVSVQDICHKPWKVVTLLLFSLAISGCGNALPSGESLSSPITTAANEPAVSVSGFCYQIIPNL